MSEALQILIAPNEDGFGTSAWAARLAKELRLACPACRIVIPVATDLRLRFHKALFEKDRCVLLARLPDGANRIELIRQSGRLDASASVQECVLTYEASRRIYDDAVSLGDLVSLRDAKLVLELGVPQLAHAVREENARRQATGQSRLPSVAFFDHAWSLTLAWMAAQAKLDAWTRHQAEHQLGLMRQDEALADPVFLFGEPIAPKVFHDYWSRVIQRPPCAIPGMLGGPMTVLEFAMDPDRLAVRGEFVKNGLFEAEIYQRARRYAKNLLGIENDLPTLFISGGGSTVWDGILGQLLQDYEQREPPYNVIVYNRVEAEKRKLRMEAHRCAVDLNGQTRFLQRAVNPASRRLLFLGSLEGETHHVLFPAFDLVLTRAGGGTVNDALAFRVPLVLVEELGMWQIEMIRQSCLKLGCAQSYRLTDLQSQGRALVENADGHLKPLAGERNQLQNLRPHAELALVRELLALAGAG